MYLVKDSDAIVQLIQNLIWKQLNFYLSQKIKMIYVERL